MRKLDWPTLGLVLLALVSLFVGACGGDDDGLGVDAVEIIAADGAAILGAKVPGLSEFAGLDVHGQVFNVFRVTCAKIVAVEDYAHRYEALATAGAKPPRWR